MIAKKIKRILFFTAFIGLFIYIYRESDKRGFVRWIDSLKLAIMLSSWFNSEYYPRIENSRFEYENITHIDVKTPASLQALQGQGIKPSGPKTYSKMGESMGSKLLKQKARFCGLEGGPSGPQNVLHIIDFRNIPTYTNKSTIATHLLDAAERAGNTTENILFLNFE